MLFDSDSSFENPFSIFFAFIFFAELRAGETISLTLVLTCCSILIRVSKLRFSIYIRFVFKSRKLVWERPSRLVLIAFRFLFEFRKSFFLLFLNCFLSIEVSVGATISLVLSDCRF